MAEPPVVVGLDGSPASAAALAWALEVAAAAEAPLEAVRAWQEPVLPLGVTVAEGPTAVADAAQRAVDEELGEALGARPADAPTVPTRTRVVEGGAGPALVTAAAQGQLLVLGRHGQSAWQRRLVGPVLGSATGHCLDRCRVPVAVVPPESTPAAPRRVAVGVDGSPASVRALHWAVDHARSVDAPLVAVMALDLTTLPVPSAAGTAWSLPPVTEWEHEAHAVLDATLSEALGGPVAATVERVVRQESPTAGVLAAVDPTDLLVLGDRGRGGFARLLLGSVSRQCVEHAPCPVVVVPSPDRGAGTS